MKKKERERKRAATFLNKKTRKENSYETKQKPVCFVRCSDTFLNISYYFKEFYKGIFSLI